MFKQKLAKTSCPKLKYIMQKRYPAQQLWLKRSFNGIIGCSGPSEKTLSLVCINKYYFVGKRLPLYRNTLHTQDA